MSVKLKKAIRERIQDIKDQRDVMVAILNEFVTEAESTAEPLLSTHKHGQFSKRYVEVMQDLDRCYHTLVLLTAEAEEKIGGGSQYMEEDDSCTEGNDDHITVVKSLPNRSLSIKSRRTLPEITGDVQCQSLPGNIVSDVPMKNVTSDTIQSAEKCLKMDPFLWNLEKHSTLDSGTANDSLSAIITSDTLAAQTSGKLCDNDVNLNRQVNKPSIVKGVFNIITPEQDTVMGALDAITPEQNTVKNAFDAIELEQETTKDTSDVLNLDQDTMMGVLDDNKPVQDSVTEIITIKQNNATFVPNQLKPEQGALKTDNQGAVVKEDQTQIIQENSLQLSSTDSLSLQGFRTYGQPKLDIEVAKRFLQGVLQQANQDNMRLNKEKRGASEERIKEKESVQERSLKSTYISDGLTKEAPVSMMGHDESEAEFKYSETEKKQRNWGEEQNSTEVKVRKIDSEQIGRPTKEALVDTGQTEKKSSGRGNNMLEESETKCKVLVNCDQNDKLSLKQLVTEVSMTETGADSEIRVPQGVEYEHVTKESVEGEHFIKESMEGEHFIKESVDAEGTCIFSRTHLVEEKLTTDVEDVISDKMSEVEVKESNIDKTDREMRASVVEDDYGLGPDLCYEILENSKIHSVVVSEAISPWSFYVQKFTVDLDNLMKELRGFNDSNPIQTPKEGMFCLAQFSKDGCFYRAKVVEVCSKGSDPFVQVFFLDYGNSESRKWSHLRRLPEKFACLPAQGILCALTQVMPDNKYGIWTEDHITLFSQIVSGKRFNCMPYYVSNDPGQPSIVGLFFNIPERVIKDGNIVMQPGPKQISIHEYMVDKNLARAVPLEEQCRLLNCSQQKEEPIHSLKKGEEDLAQRGGGSRKKDVQCQSIVSVGSSMETLSDSTHSVPRLPKSTTRDERERKTLEEKGKRETRSRRRVGQDKQCKARSANTAGKGSEDTSKSKAKEQHSEQQIEEAWDSSSVPACSTPVSEDRGCNNLNVDKSQMTSPGKVPENQQCPQNIMETKIQNLADDCVSVRSSESESLQYTVDQSVSLPTNIDVDVQGLKIMLSYVKSLSSFYVHLVSEMCAKTIDCMHKSLNKTMEQMSRKQQQKMSKSYKPCVGDLCCVLFAEDNQYYRGLVTGFVLASPTKASDNKELLPENVGKVNVFYLDFGNDEIVPKRRVFPLPSQYADVPGLAIHACLAYIQPSISKESPKKNVHWTEEAVQKFISVTGFDSPLNMIIVDGDIQKMLENHPSEVVRTPPLQVLLVDSCKEEEEEDVCVNMDLIRLGIARLCATGNSSQQEPSSDQQAVTSPEGLKDWNPMLEDFMDVRNSYKVDVDDAGVATVGIKVQDEKKICKYYQKNKCWRGDRCPYRHVIVPEGSLTGDVDYVYGDVMEEYHQDSLPDPGTWIACEVSTIINPAHFYIVLPFGKEPLASLEPAKKEEGYSSFHQETLEDLMASLQEFYGGKHFEGSYVDYAPGEMVVARYSVDLQWCRARVISSGDRKVEVFYVDFGNKEFVLDTSIRNIDPQFLHLPFQALECFLVDIEPVGGTDRFTPEAKYEFRRQVDGKTLVAYIKSRSWSGCAWVELFDTSGEDDVSIAQSLIDRGLAQESTALSSTTSGQGSNTSSRVSSEESLILLPG